MIKLIVLNIVLFLLTTLSYTQSVNGGFTFPTNGPCIPQTNMGGLCNDNGVMAVYGVDGILFHLPVAGPRGLQGNPGVTPSVTIGTVATGTPGTPAGVKNTGVPPNVILNFTIPAGQDGLPGKDAVFPQTFLLSCQPGPGSIPKGFVNLVCTQTKAP